MSLPARFNADLCNFLKQKVASYDWDTEFPIGGPTRERVDVGGEPTETGRRRLPIVLVEVELRREDPASNILKVWHHLLEGGYPEGVVLVQGFSKVYLSPKQHARGVRYRAAKRLGKFVQESTKRRFRYVPIEIPYYPRAGSNEGDGARRRWARWLGVRVVTSCRKLGLET